MNADDGFTIVSRRRKRYNDKQCVLHYNKAVDLRPSSNQQSITNMTEFINRLEYKM